MHNLARAWSGTGSPSVWQPRKSTGAVLPWREAAMARSCRRAPGARRKRRKLSVRPKWSRFTSIV
eukprot:274651-Pleurochrysis_carterae.AAC.3